MSAAEVRALVLDYGGVLTNPLAETTARFCRTVGIGPEQLFGALGAVGRAWGEDPMSRLEVAGCTEAELTEAVLAHLPARVGSVLSGRGFGEVWFEGRHSEPAVVELVRQARAAGLRTGLLTNNVVEWRPLWTAQLEPDLFDVVVDSSVELCRKPDPRIYLTLLARLGLAPAHVLFCDDVSDNLAAAGVAGLQTLLWQGPASVAEVRATLGLPHPGLEPGIELAGIGGAR